VVALIVVSLLGQTPFLETGSSEWRLWVPWAIFHTGDNPDGTQTLIAGNPAAYLGYLLALGALAVLGAMWHDRTARTPRFRILVAAVAATAVVLFVLAATTGNHDNRDSDPIPSRITG
jgi:4-amino-4-deoxy-L-arabinose transferase-like glycosyltransferase